MNWQYSGRVDQFIYMSVDPQTKADKEQVTSIVDGGSVERNGLTSIKAAGSVPFIDQLDIGNDYLRIYSESTLHGETERVAHGTFLVSTPTAELYGCVAKGDADLYSLLHLATEQAFDEPYSIAEGTNAVGRAKALIEALGLNVVADSASATLTNAANFDAGTSVLEVVNWLLSYAGFSSADVDGYGNVLMTLYADPSNLAPVVTFEDGENCTFLPSVAHELDIFDVPNKVIAVMSNMDTVMTASATNTDPNNRYSTVSRGERVIPHVEEVADIASQAALQALADRVLADKTSAVESIEIEHIYAPFRMGDAGRLIYTQAGFDFTGVAVRSALTLQPGMPCISRFRRFIRM